MLSATVHLRRWAWPKGAGFLPRRLVRDYPAVSQRLRGIVEAAGIGLKAVYLFKALVEPVISSVATAPLVPGRARPWRYEAGTLRRGTCYRS